MVLSSHGNSRPLLKSYKKRKSLVGTLSYSLCLLELDNELGVLQRGPDLPDQVGRNGGGDEPDENLEHELEHDGHAILL